MFQYRGWWVRRPQPVWTWAICRRCLRAASPTPNLCSSRWRNGGNEESSSHKLRYAYFYCWLIYLFLYFVNLLNLLSFSFTNRINIGCLKSLFGVQCEKRMPVHIKGNSNRPWRVMVKAGDLRNNKLYAEMRIFRWARDVSMLDRNIYVRGSFRVTPVRKELMESRLRW